MISSVADARVEDQRGLAVLEIYHPKELQDKKYDGDDDQNVNPTASFREPRTYIATEKAKQPQDY